jgi:RNA polymerase sigma factor (sigma-70 family)
MTDTTDELVQRALDGDRAAVHAIVASLQTSIYGIAIRMLWNRADAEDATQEILIRIVTRLSQFQRGSRLETWAYRIAVNYLLDVKRSPVERMKLGFVELGADLGTGLGDDGPAETERSVLVEEVKIGCTLAMLQCLDRPHRAAYVLGEILGLSTVDASAALGIDASTYRKRLERSRDKIEAFAREHCGLVSDAAPCRCNRRVPTALAIKRVNQDDLQLARGATSVADLRGLVRAVEHARHALELHRSSQPRPSDVDFANRVMLSLGTTLLA